MAEQGCPIGVTGGIGAGKSAVLRLLADLGARTVDADEVVHALYERDQPGQVAVRNRWGDRVLTAAGRVDRAVVAEIVFGNSAELQWLNGAIHPLVQGWIRKLANTSREPLYCGIPLLFETGWDRFVWRSVSVWCSPAVQRQRLRQRGWDEREIGRRLACQMGMDDKLTRGDFAIINNGSWEHLREQCRILKSRLEGLVYETRATDT